MSIRILLPALLAAFPLAVLAATPIDETRPLDARGKVEISNVKGRIEVRVWDKPEVHVGGSLGRGVEKLEIEGDGNELEIKVRYPRYSNNTESTTLVIDVPTLASLDIDGVAAQIDVTGTAGRSLEIGSVSGNVTVAGAPGSVDIESVSGDLQLALNSTDIDVQSVSGDITLRGRLEGEIQSETVSGDFAVDSRGQRVRRLSSSTVSGDATLNIGLADGGRISAESVSGDIEVIVPRTLSATVRGESFSGDLNAPGAEIHKPEFGPGSNFEHRYGSGNGEIRMETFSGSAELRLK